MWVSKVPNYDAYGLFRALHSHNPLQYSHIVGLSSHFYVYAPLRSEQNEHPLDVLLHIGAGSKVFHPLMSKLKWMKDLCPLASYNKTTQVNSTLSYLGSQMTFCC